jgi:hypothetical protein
MLRVAEGCHFENGYLWKTDVKPVISNTPEKGLLTQWLEEVKGSQKGFMYNQEHLSQECPGPVCFHPTAHEHTFLLTSTGQSKADARR